MAIIGRIRKHSGLAVIIVGVAIAAFVIGDFGKKRARGTNDIGSVNGEPIPYNDFNTKVDQTLTLQKESKKVIKLQMKTRIISDKLPGTSWSGIS